MLGRERWSVLKKTDRMSWRWQDAMEALWRLEWWKILGGQGKQGTSILRSEEYEWTHLRPETDLIKSLGPLTTCDLHEDTNITCFLKFKSVLAVFILYVWMFGLHYMNVYQVAYLVPKEVRRRHGTPWNWSNGCLWATRYWELNPGSLAEWQVLLPADQWLPSSPIILNLLNTNCKMFQSVPGSREHSGGFTCIMKRQEASSSKSRLGKLFRIFEVHTKYIM